MELANQLLIISILQFPPQQTPFILFYKVIIFLQINYLSKDTLFRIDAYVPQYKSQPF